MADVDLLIKIPEEIINEINDENYQKVISWYDTTLCCAIKDATPLPKGHGRLIDADALRYSLSASDIDIYCKAVIEEDAPTIIEADKEK